MTVREANKILEIKAQIQEDLIAWATTIPLHENCVDEVCQIVVENFENKNFHE